MRRMYVTSLFRLESPGESPYQEMGRLYVVDWDTKQLLNNPYEVDPGLPTSAVFGRSHGARGVTILGDTLYVAGSNDKISKFSLDTMCLIETLEFPELSYVHQIRSRDGKLYVSSTGNDKRFILEDDKIIDVLDLQKFHSSFAGNPNLIHDWGRDRLHFNSIGWDSNGDENHVYFNARAIFNVDAGKVVFMDNAPGPPDQLLYTPHDVLFHCGNILINSSASRKTICFNEATGNGHVIYENKKEAPDQEIGKRNQFGFTRVLASNGSTVFNGATPMLLNEFVYNESEDEYQYVDSLDLTTTLHEAIFDMVLDPRDW